MKEKRSYYEMKKEDVRDEAITYVMSFSRHSYSYYEIMFWSDYFYKQGKRYGLLKEFRENGVI